jgi:hypothetical protein
MIGDMTRRKRQQNSRGIPIYRHDGAAVIGQVIGDTFHKRARSSTHMLRRPRAWACDVDALDQAQAAGAVWVAILDQDTGRTYRAALADFLSRGVRVNRGHSDQLGLTLNFWQVTGGRGGQMTGAGLDQAQAAGPQQLALGL